MAPGWFFKKGKPKKVFPAKYNNRPRVRGSTMTPVARVLSEQKVGSKASEEGAAVLYRDHNRSHGTVQHKVTEAHPRFGQEHLVPVTIFGEYRHVPESKRPPIVNAIYARITTRVEELNPRRQALTYWNHIQVRDDPFLRLYYFFSGNCGFFVERDYVQNRIRMSRDYEASSARALYKSERWDRISWGAVEITPACDPPD